MAAKSDMIVAISPEIAARWSRRGYDVEMIANGTDVEAFADVETAPPALDLYLKPPIAVLMGKLNARADPALLEAVINHGVSLLLIGPDKGAPWLDDLAKRPNVQWVGSQPFTALPGYLRHASLGLVPYTRSEFNDASFPLKLLEYLAAGLPAVTTDLPAVRWLNAPWDVVQVADSPGAFAAAAAAACQVPLTPEARAARRQFAEAHSYERRANELLAAIDRRLEIIGSRAPDRK